MSETPADSDNLADLFEAVTDKTVAVFTKTFKECQRKQLCKDGERAAKRGAYRAFINAEFLINRREELLLMHLWKRASASE